MYCQFPAVSSNVLDVTYILVHEVMAMYIMFRISIDVMLSGSRPFVDFSRHPSVSRDNGVCRI